MKDFTYTHTVWAYKEQIDKKFLFTSKKYIWKCFTVVADKLFVDGFLVVENFHKPLYSFLSAKGWTPSFPADSVLVMMNVVDIEKFEEL